MGAESAARVCLLTGATLGIGRAAAEALAPLGLELVLVARDRPRLEALAAELRARTPGAKVAVLAGDLSRTSEVRRIAAEFRASHARLHLLLNNAGALFARREVTPEGRERTFALNHLAYFVLTQELLPLLKASAPSRIVNVSSDAHLGMRLDFDDLDDARGRYRPFVAYGRSKLMNLLFTRELARRLEGSGVTANTMHPGFVRTGFGRNNAGMLGTVVKWGQAFARTPEKGAETLVYLATSPDVEGVSGKYFHDMRERRSSRASQDMEAARRLWDVSAQLVGPAAAAA
ncbi:MAG TPA: SDR family oxidoreductase [Myxococcaceae bacterium]|nr:SDR family oxidoreductase [Myxococcaceae bacterium]